MENSANNEQIGIIVISHGDLSASLLRTTENILGPLNDCASISVDIAHESSEAVRRINSAARRMDKGKGVLILTDMFGGTPANIALSLIGQYEVEVVTGVNLPMMIKAFTSRSTDLKSLASLVENAGREGILDAGHILRVKGKE